MVDSTPLIPDGKDEEEKQGHKVLCCFDSRKAVLIFSAIALVFTIAIFTDAATSGKADAGRIINFIVNIIVFIVAMVGAFTFGIQGVVAGIVMAIANIIWFAVYLVRNREWLAQNQGTEEGTAYIVIVAIAYLVFLLMIYANSVYVYEVRKGIMSKETHSREKYSW